MVGVITELNDSASDDQVAESGFRPRLGFISTVGLSLRKPIAVRIV